ncbi:sugar porter family MFS transporter [Haladaptatus caseinilyticus]|uniref:sugar porter family MFS transporter n=1 Tax=Haladaptatus caseinilyticus TaxID=2993314 RepID=UPI00224AE6F8|nr:sugar porter family MFS transporter [Haladaptatus caseinilyticus]
METSTDSNTNTNRFVYITATIAALNGLLFGFDTGVISGALLYIKRTFELSPAMQEVVVSATLVGAILGAAVGGRLADRLGRRRLMITGAGVFFVGSLLMGLAPNVPWLVAGRFVVGVAIGVASMAGPLYISEIAPPKIRGSLVSLNQLAVTTGILLAYLVNYAFAGPGGWRWMLGAGVVPAMVLGVGMLFMPESPRWLIERGRNEDARSVLSRTRTDEQIERELRDIRRTEEVEEDGLSTLLQSWVRPALVVGVGLAVLQQITGINTVIYYAPTIFESTGFEASASILATVGVGLVNVTMTIVAVLLIDRVGRRPLLLVGLTGMTLALTGLAAAFVLPGLSGLVGWVAVGSLMLYVGFFAIGMGPVFWLLISEIYPLQVRGSAMGVVTVANWASNLAVSFTFLSLVGAVGQSGTFGLYAGLSVLALLFVYTKVPETKGRSLEAIEADLRDGSSGAYSDATAETVEDAN